MKKVKYKKMLISLPEPLVKKLVEYADKLHGGNKSGFVAQALEDKIEYLRKAYHTQKMREAYKKAANRNLRITKEWEPLDDELWQKLDETEKAKR